MNFNRHSAFTKVLVVFIREIEFIAPACTGLAWAGLGWAGLVDRWAGGESRALYDDAAQFGEKWLTNNGHAINL